jgi:hypothetical protein
MPPPKKARQNAAGSRHDNDHKNLDAARQRLETWIGHQLENPPAEGQGRNNFMIMVTPRMLELGWDEDGIFEAWKTAFDLEDDDSKDDEVRRAIESAKRYITPIAIESKAEIRKRKIVEERAHQAGARALDGILRDYSWTMAEIAEAGGMESWTPAEQTDTFLATMFMGYDHIWAGMPWQSGVGQKANGKTFDYRQNFKTIDDWRGIKNLAHEFISHCTFKPGSENRSNSNVQSMRYMVVESDELDVNQVGAVFNWMVSRGAKLRAVVFSGRRSLHGWFDWESDNNTKELGAMLKGLKCDPSTLRASQPVRLAGRTRKDTKTIQTLLYLDTP